MNRMTETVSNSNTITTTIGTLNRTYFLNVLYPPDINISHSGDLREGENAVITCAITDGKTTQSTIYWLTRNGTEVHNTIFTISNLTRYETGNYTCQLRYSIEPTYGDKTNGSRKQAFYLDVQYKSEITRFFVQHHEHLTHVTVDENDTVQLACIVDSNPSSTMSISFYDTLNVKEIRRQDETKTLYHEIYDSSCTDTGIYTCTGSNSVSKPGQSSRRQVLLFVNCAPRKSPSTAAENNISIVENELELFTYSVVAYPQPTFVLYQLLNDSQTVTVLHWTHHVSNKLFVEWTIYFTLTNVTSLVYGRYTLRVYNSVGELSFSFYLTPKAIVENKKVNGIQHTTKGYAVGGTAAGIVSVMVFFAVIYIVRKRRIEKRHNDEVTHNSYQNINLGCGSTNPMDAASSVYERLQNTGSEQEYQKLSNVACENKQITDKVYENLRLSHQHKQPELGEVSSRNHDTDLSKKHNLSRV